MSEPLPCPFLPPFEPALDFRLLRGHGSSRGADFYFDALRYGQSLWGRGFAGRAILAVTRALYADVPAEAPVLLTWPLPYAALRWMVEHHDADEFPGNPRVSFQHQASRFRGVRQAQRSARAWAVWGLVRVARPTLDDDAAQPLVEPGFAEIVDLLEQHGHPGEARLWSAVLGRERWANAACRPGGGHETETNE